MEPKPRDLTRRDAAGISSDQTPPVSLQNREPEDRLRILHDIGLNSSGMPRPRILRPSILPQVPPETT